jgi:hypothetical protein
MPLAPPNDQEVTMKLRTTVPVLTALLILGTFASACAEAPATTPGDTGTSASGGIDHPTAATELVLRVSAEGGFVAAESLLTSVPSFSLFGDGTAVTQGAQTAIYPGPALPPLIATPITEDGIQALVRSALDAGLGEDHEYTDLGSVGISDADTTVFTLTADGVTHVTKAYALGMSGGRQPDVMPDQEYAARLRLERFQASLTDLRNTLPAGSVGPDGAFVPATLRLFVSGHRRSEDLKEPAITWPLSTPLASLGDPASLDGYRCGTVTGADLDAVWPLAQTANQLTPWTSEGDRFAIAFRPLLPDESGC